MNCGNDRFFYQEVSVPARRLIDANDGVRNGKILAVNRDRVDRILSDDYICNSCYSANVQVKGAGAAREENGK
ncbi:hypothetical protein P8884_00280 [Bacillus haynesii]|nr:hypothetical protein [Bacillus haynesii]